MRQKDTGYVFLMFSRLSRMSVINKVAAGTEYKPPRNASQSRGFVCKLRALYDTGERKGFFWRISIQRSISDSGQFYRKAGGGGALLFSAHSHNGGLNFSFDNPPYIQLLHGGECS